jgi:hypothetical protein
MQLIRRAVVAAMCLGQLDWAYAEATQLTERLPNSEPSLETEELFRDMMRFRELAVEWAHVAAAYCHPRLAAIAHRHTNADGRPVQPVVNVYIHGNPRPEGAGLLSEPGDNIPDSRASCLLLADIVAKVPNGPALIFLL